MNVVTTSKVEITTPVFVVNAAEVVQLNTPLVVMNGTHLEVIGDIHATETIIDDLGNTNHHGH